jgi:hypothetical protein
MEVLGADRMLGIDESIVVETGEDFAVGVHAGGALDGTAAAQRLVVVRLCPTRATPPE